MSFSLTRNLEKAKDAYKNKSVKESIAAHNGSAPEEHQNSGQYIKSAIYGGLDGIITTFAVVAGVAGAALSPNIVLILGFANLIGDGLSMAIGDYLSTKAEREYHQAERRRETWELKTYPEGEKKEMMEIYQAKGYTKEESQKIVELMSKNEKAFVDVMMVEELGIIESDESPTKNALVTFFSFAFFGLIPLLAFVASVVLKINFNTFIIASILTGITLFVLGAIKTKVTGKNWIYSGLEMLLVGGIAAGAAYLIGYLVSLMI